MYKEKTIIQRTQFRVFFLLGNGREKKEREKPKTTTQNYCTISAVYSLLQEPNQHINDMKTYFPHGDNQALSQH